MAKGVAANGDQIVECVTHEMLLLGLRKGPAWKA
jgi:hypothetical protein